MVSVEIIREHEVEIHMGDGQPLTDGKLLTSLPLVLVENNENDYFKVHIKGLLASGSNLDRDFKIFNSGDNEGESNIVVHLVPEQMTLILLSISAIVLFQKRKSDHKINPNN